MEFTSITEYFYKISSRLLLILLIPIFFFIYVYLQPVLVVPAQPSPTPDTLNVVAVIMVLVWITGFIFFNKKIKSIRKGQGLREKLEKYSRLTIVRYIFFSLCSLFLAIGFLLTRNDMFALVFILQLVVAGVVWPFSSKVSNDLKLRGAEREMVYYRKDTLS